MKTVFIVNPKAGQGKNTDLLINSIEKAIAETGADASLYVTKAVGDAEVYTSEYCKNNGPARFIACGGDGTLNEVLNGAIEYPDAEIGVIPRGTGNDFCRNFGDGYDFTDIRRQIGGNTVKCDAIKYSTYSDSVNKQGYCVNMFNIGFDCNVADMTASMKKKPLISGSLAYFLSILVTLIKKKGADLQIEIDGEMVYNGRLLLTSVANGSYCGGGIKSNPFASTSDGLININIIKNVSRLKFISLLPHYMKGTVFELIGIEKYIASRKCKHIKLTPNTDAFRLCIDGEIIDGGVTEFDIVPNAFNFVIPGETSNAGENTAEKKPFDYIKR